LRFSLITSAGRLPLRRILPKNEWSRRVRILVLEDDPFIALDLQSILEEQGHEVGLFGSVVQAHEHLDDAFDYALLDVEVGDGTSFPIAETLAERRIPFAFVSGVRRTDLPAVFRRAAFIPKPFAETSILRTVEQVETRLARYH
jgi:DNA-binding response OmpR family regulator